MLSVEASPPNVRSQSVVVDSRASVCAIHIGICQVDCIAEGRDRSRTSKEKRSIPVLVMCAARFSFVKLVRRARSFQKRTGSLVRLAHAAWIPAHQRFQAPAESEVGSTLTVLREIKDRQGLF